MFKASHTKEEQMQAGKFHPRQQIFLLYKVSEIPNIHFIYVPADTVYMITEEVFSPTKPIYYPYFYYLFNSKKMKNMQAFLLTSHPFGNSPCLSIQLFLSWQFNSQKGKLNLIFNFKRKEGRPKEYNFVLIRVFFYCH